MSDKKSEETIASNAYDKVFNILNKMESCCFDIPYLIERSKCHIFGIRLKEKYGLELEPTNIVSTMYQKFGNDMAITKMGKKYQKYISWSDNGAQPEDDEILLEISFPTGAYIFGDDYPIDIFKMFFDELKTYLPKYIDTNNKYLYFSLNNAAKVFNNYYVILNKYKDLNIKDRNKREIERLKKQIQTLEDPQ